MHIDVSLYVEDQKKDKKESITVATLKPLTSNKSTTRNTTMEMHSVTSREGLDGR